MTTCKKCGNKLNRDAKFCIKCGASVDKENSKELEESNIEEIDLKKYTLKESDESIDKKKSNKIIKILLPLLLVIVLVILGFGLFWYSNRENDKIELQEASLEIIDVDVSKYPSIVLTVDAKDFSKNLNVSNFTIKEDQVFQKDITFEDGPEGRYLLSYRTSDESKSGEISVKVAYGENNKDITSESIYIAPKKEKESKSVNSDSTVNTYDDNETEIISLMNVYLYDFVRMVNSRNIDYTTDEVDINGDIYKSFEATLKSYEEQEITESLLEEKVQDINKISDSQYEVTTYEKYRIYYGKENKSKIMEFSTKYTIKKVNNKFKIYAINDIQKLGEK